MSKSSAKFDLSKITFPSDWPSVASKDFQKYLYNFYYNNKSNIKPIPHTELNNISGNKCISRNTADTTEDRILSLIQSSSYMIIKHMAKVDDPETRGMLFYHSTGSGKTVIATSIMDSFWDTSKNIIFLSSVENLKSNSRNVFYTEASRYFDRFKNYPDMQKKNKAERIKNVESMFQKRNVMFLTFAQISHYLLIYKELKSVKSEKDKHKHKNLLNNAILIIDEVHNIFKPLPNQREEHLAIKNFLLDHSNPLAKNLKIFILTATPGDSPKDIVELLNIIRRKNSPEIAIPDVNNEDSLNTFKSKITGLISFFDSSFRLF